MAYKIFLIVIVVSIVFIASYFFLQSKKELAQIVLPQTWRSADIPAQNIKLTVRTIELGPQERSKFATCVLIQTPISTTIAQAGSYNEYIVATVEKSQHSIVTARIDYKDKIQWQVYTSNIELLNSSLHKLELPFGIEWGAIEDSSWSEYDSHEKLLP